MAINWGVFDRIINAFFKTDNKHYYTTTRNETLFRLLNAGFKRNKNLFDDQLIEVSTRTLNRGKDLNADQIKKLLSIQNVADELKQNKRKILAEAPSLEQRLTEKGSTKKTKRNITVNILKIQAEAHKNEPKKLRNIIKKAKKTKLLTKLTRDRFEEEHKPKKKKKNIDAYLKYIKKHEAEFSEIEASEYEVLESDIIVNIKGQYDAIITRSEFMKRSESIPKDERNKSHQAPFQEIKIKSISNAILSTWKAVEIQKVEVKSGVSKRGNEYTYKQSSPIISRLIEKFPWLNYYREIHKRKLKWEKDIVVDNRKAKERTTKAMKVKISSGTSITEARKKIISAIKKYELSISDESGSDEITINTLITKLRFVIDFVDISAADIQYFGSNFIQSIGDIPKWDEYCDLCNKKDGLCFKNYISLALNDKISAGIPENPVSKEYILDFLDNNHINYRIYNGLLELIESRTFNKRKTLAFILDSMHVIPIKNIREISTSAGTKSQARKITASRRAEAASQSKLTLQEYFESKKWNYIDENNERHKFDKMPFIDIRSTSDINYVDPDKLDDIFWEKVAKTRKIPQNRAKEGEIINFISDAKLTKSSEHQIIDKYQLEPPYEIASCVNKAYSKIFGAAKKGGLYYTSSKSQPQEQKIIKFDKIKAYLSIITSQNQYPIFFMSSELKKYDNSEIIDYDLYHTSYGWFYGDELKLIIKFYAMQNKKIEIFESYPHEVVIKHKFVNFDKIPPEDLKRIYTRYIGNLAHSKDSVVSSHITYGDSSAKYYESIGCEVNKINYHHYIDYFTEIYGNKIGPKYYEASNDIKSIISDDDSDNEEEFDSKSVKKQKHHEIELENFYSVERTKEREEVITYKFVNWRILALCTISILEKLFNDIDNKCYTFNDLLEIRIDSIAVRQYNKKLPPCGSKYGEFRHMNDIYYAKTSTPAQKHKPINIPNFDAGKITLTYGRAGTGKTYTLKQDAKKAELKYNASNKVQVIKVAPTRTAANLIEGKTFHRQYGFENVNKLNIDTSQKVELFYDEVSMCQYSILFVLYSMYVAGSNVHLYGDFRQLPPVYDSDNIPDDLNERTLKKICKCTELTELHRFSALDPLYILSENLDFSKLQRKKLNIDINTRCLAYTNKTTDKINTMFASLSKHPSAPYVCKTSTAKYDNGELRRYKDIPGEDLHYFKLAFCTTIHTKQGGQFDKKNDVYLFDIDQYDKKLAYTAVTRCINFDQLHAGSFH